MIEYKDLIDLPFHMNSIVLFDTANRAGWTVEGTAVSTTNFDYVIVDLITGELTYTLVFTRNLPIKNYGKIPKLNLRNGMVESPDLEEWLPINVADLELALAS